MEKKSADYPEVPVSVLRKLKKGDKKAFDEVYHAYKARIYGNLFRLVKSEDIARDLLQEVFVRLWEKRELLDPEQPVHSWMFRVATNLAMDFFRKASRDRTLEKQIITIAAGNDAYNHVEEQLFGKELNMMLNQAIEQLSPRRREIFKLIKLKGKSYEEVSQMLGISPSTINDHIVKATHTLREHMKRMDILGLILMMAAAGYM